MSRLTRTWHVHTDGTVVSSPLVRNGVVFVLTDGDYLYAIDERSGAVLWRTEADGYSGIGLTGPTVVLTTVNSAAAAFDAATGRHLWTSIFGNPETGVASPTVFGTDLFVTNGETLARFTNKGRVIWRRPLSCATPAVDARNVYAAAYVGKGTRFMRLDRRTGKTVTAARASAGGAQALAVSHGGAYLLLMTSGTVHKYALQGRDAVSGKTHWTIELGSSKWLPPAETMLAVSPGTVYAAVPDGYVYAVATATGRLRWRAPIESTPSSPILANGVLYVVDGNGAIVALAEATGRQLWSATATPFANIQPSSPTVVNGAVLVAGDDGVMSFRLPADVTRR